MNSDDMMHARPDKTLLAFFGGTLVGTLSEDTNGKPDFTYDPAWASSPGAIPLSLSMPMTASRHGARQVAPFLWGLLPENPLVLETLARDHRISPRNPVALLGVVGEDCAGAVQFLRPDRVDVLHQPGSIIWLDEAEMARRLHGLREQAGSIGRYANETGQFSLAGAQAKTAFYRDGARWGVPSGRMPTTHILKPPMPGLKGQVENEFFCLSLARAAGFAAAHSAVMQFGDESCIVVERYDRLRRTPQSAYVRVHQEDMCQALSIMPTRKYQSDGGPSIRDVVRVLHDNATAPLDDMRQFLRAVALNFIILGTDAHAKNFSLLIGRGAVAQIRLAPLYDLNSYLPYAEDTRGLRMALSVGGVYVFADIMPRHWAREARQCGLPPEQVLGDVRDLVARLPDLAADVARRCRASGLAHEVIGVLADGVAARCAGLERVFGAAGVG